MASIPCILYVTMQRTADLPPLHFQDWYNNEHGPLRLRLSDFVTNGFRYRATDLQGSGQGKPEWMAVYDITDNAEMTKAEYMSLRGPPIQSERERQLRPYIKIDRRCFDVVKEWRADNFKPLERLDTVPGEESLVSVSVMLKDGSRTEEITKWYEEEQIPALRKMQGWQQTKTTVTSVIDAKDEVEYLAVHTFAKPTSSEDLLSVLGISLPSSISSNLKDDPIFRTYNMHYIFGPAPRDLAPLQDSSTPSFDSPATETRTIPSSAGTPAIESYITTKDGVRLRYRLEGSPDPDAPLIVLSNSILVDYGIWDNFVKAFFAKEQNRKYRILRYQTRGRTSDCGSQSITMELLASDIISMLDALRVPQAALVVGVSMGGATVLCAALNHPSRIARFISCDTNSKNPASNKKQWEERITVAEDEGAVSMHTREKVVGEKLAEMTARRWFVKESYDGGDMEEECERVKRMVYNNSLEGFKHSVQALCGYDLTEKMASYKGKGRFLVGAGDGVLPKTMKEMASSLGDGNAELVIIEGAGHLPMVEKPEDVAGAVTEFLEA